MAVTPQVPSLSSARTHEVLNQAPPLVDYNLFRGDQALVDALRREGGGWAESRAEEFGLLQGSAQVIRWGIEANEHPPVLHTHDRYGNRRDEVEFHPAWHELMKLSIAHGLHSLPWSDSRPGAQVARAALMMLAGQNEAGHLCPVSMTCSAVPALRRQPDLARQWEPRLLSASYDPRFRPSPDKSGALAGMAMTEKQGGSDVRANTTRAEPIGPGEHLLTGHKWFCSAPMCDAFLVLAQAPRGLSCFLLPRWTPDGERNRFFLQRLKPKLGNRSNASSEVEFEEAWARLVGEEGRGIATILEMVQHTRLDCVISSTALMRQAATQAIHHAGHRSAFGRRLADQPLMRNVLADLCVESEAATLLMMRLARAFEQDPVFARLATAAAKFWVCKRAIHHVAEALECLGGNGYVEESAMPRLYREAPVNSLWEGSGNVICLDVLRALTKEPNCAGHLLEEVRLASGADRRLDAHIAWLEAALGRPVGEPEARRLAEGIALALQGSLLARHSPPEVLDAFCATRLAGRQVFGTLPEGASCAAIIERGACSAR